MVDEAHSLLGASSAHRWLSCPGSFRLSQVAPHRPTSVYAAAGTAAHAYIEKFGLTPVPVSEIGKSWHVEGHTGTVDQAFIDGVNVMLQYLQGAPVDFIALESRVSIDRYFASPPTPLFGTADAILAKWVESPKTLEIVDYKNGAGVAVSPAWNPQLLYYAAGALLIWPEIQDWTRIRLTIVQPHAGGEAIRSWDLAHIDLLMWITEVLIPGVHACEDPDAPLKAGEWCRFCPVAPHCPLLHEAAQAAAKTEFDEFIVDETSDAGAKYLGDDGTKLAEYLEQAERAELWIAAVREFALDQLQRQVRIPGWELVPTRATRKWTKPDDDIAAALRDAGVMPKVIWETRLRSPAQMEKTLHGSRAGRQVWANTVEGQRLFERRSSGVKVGRAGTRAQEDFDDL